MSFLAKVTDFVGGSLFKEIKEGVMSYFPPDMTPQQKADTELGIQKFLHQKQIDANQILSESSKQLDKRISEQEGTASDLKSIPVLGTIIIFLRGVQRPAWGFYAMYIDSVWFTKPSMILINDTLVPAYTEQQQTALIVINILVLGFLFGERTIKNLTPLIIKVFGGQK